MTSNTSISEKIKNKIDEIVKEPKERKFLYEILERELTYGAKIESSKIKKEFKLILDQHFPYEAKKE